MVSHDLTSPRGLGCQRLARRRIGLTNGMMMRVALVCMVADGYCYDVRFDLALRNGLRPVLSLYGARQRGTGHRVFLG